LKWIIKYIISFIYFLFDRIISFKDELHTDEQATVTFRFRNRCEYVMEGSRLIFRSSNQTKGSGHIIKVLPQQQTTTTT
jgi:hypothetical protein